MRRLTSVLVGVISAALVQTHAWGSWAQTDNATSDQELKHLTEEGSREFLGGAARLQEAMTKLDEGKPKEAISLSDVAAEEFGLSGKLFANAGDRIREREQTADELRKFLKSVDYAEKARRLGLNQLETSLAWKSIQSLAAQGRADQLMDLAARNAGSLREGSRAFSEAVRNGTYAPVQGAALLAELGEQIKFGALVSGIFSR